MIAWASLLIAIGTMEETGKKSMERPPLAIPPGAQAVHDSIVDLLYRMADTDYPSVINDEFRQLYGRAMELYDEYQRLTVAASGYPLSCGRGCWICCCHYPEDVYSFEAEIIAHSLAQFPREKRERVKELCARAVDEIERLRPIVADRILLAAETAAPEEVDPEEVLLNSYYQLNNRCPLLDANNRCSIYSLRPLTCRAYINLGDPAACSPEMIHEADISTYILDLDDEANELLDELHARHERYPGDTALCSLLLKHLRETD
jgi:Fe-S-cluster containining protein